MQENDDNRADNRPGIRKALAVIMSRPQVKAILVNILGGVTRCDLVAQGIIEALNEATARFPFALCGLVGSLGIYLLGRRAFGERAGLIAFFLFAINGYFIGFARVVQYQSLVLTMSILAHLQSGGSHAAGVGGLAGTIENPLSQE